MNTQYDAVVIGAGSGGLTAAVGLSKVGKRVLLIEREHMGGECTNTGCIPSKALLHAAKAGMDGKQALHYVRETINNVLAEETPETFTAMGIDVIMGEARFVGPDAIEVNETTYRYQTAIIATGSSPRMVDVPGLQEKHILTNQNIFSLEDIPKRLLIIGGGPIGMEMAQACARLGSEVTIAEHSDTFARLEDESIRPILHESFADLGVTIKTDAAINKVEGTTAHFNVTNNGTTSDTFTTKFDKVLVAIGRTANLPEGLTDAGIKANKHGVVTDDQHRTSNEHIYAVGDVAQRLKFTHTADDSARQVVARIASKGILRVKKNKVVPKVTYTTPEAAQVGMSWTDAQAKYSQERLMRIEVPFTHNDRAKTDGATTGMLVVIVRRLTGSVLGAHLIGPSAGEIISIFTLAIDQKISMWKLQSLIFPYPTYSLIIKKAADQFVGRQLADMKTDLLQSVRRSAPKVLLGLVWVLALLALYRYQTTQEMTVSETALRLFDFISLTIWGPLLYILAYTIRPLTFFPGTALTILSGVFFGLWGGILYTIIAANLSAAVAYVVGRFFGKNVELQDSAVGNWVQALRNNPFAAVLTTRLIFLPFDVVSYAAGILKLPFVSFTLATFVGTLLGIATFVSIGASIDIDAFRTDGFSTEVIDTQFVLISLVILVVSVTFSKLLKRRQVK